MLATEHPVGRKLDNAFVTPRIVCHRREFTLGVDLLSRVRSRATDGCRPRKERVPKFSSKDRRSSVILFPPRFLRSLCAERWLCLLVRTIRSNCSLSTFSLPRFILDFWTLVYQEQRFHKYIHGYIN